MGGEMKHLLPVLDDVCLLAGCACIVIGVAMLSVPAAWIVGGVELIAFGLLIGRKMAHAAVAKPVQ